MKVSGSWRYIHRAVDQYGQVIDVFMSKKRDLKAATTFFADAIGTHGEPAEIATDRAHASAMAPDSVRFLDNCLLQGVCCQ